MFDELIYKNRWIIVSGLTLVIVVSLGLILFNKMTTSRRARTSAEVSELQKQNDELRQQLSNREKKVAGVTEEESADKINLNTADAGALDQLPNIGAARAQAIIAYREQNGGFKSIEEVKNIKGIGDKYFEEMKDLITVGQ